MYHSVFKDNPQAMSLRVILFLCGFSATFPRHPLGSMHQNNTYELAYPLSCSRNSATAHLLGMHPGCKIATIPKTRTEYWLDKFSKNVANDAAHYQALEKDGWHVIVIWQCQLKNMPIISVIPVSEPFE